MHNRRCRFTHGYYCEDCNCFFEKAGPTYRSTELMSKIWMVLNNINVELKDAGKTVDEEVAQLKERIGIGKDHAGDYEELIAVAQSLLARHGKTVDSATFAI